MHDRDRHAAPLQPPGRFEAEQTAADDDGPPVPLGSRDHRIDIGDVTKGVDAGQAQPGDRRGQRLRPGAEQEFVVGDGSIAD